MNLTLAQSQQGRGKGQKHHPLVPLSVLFGLLQLGKVLFLWWVVCTGPPIVRGAHGVVATPIPLTQDPGQRIYFEVQLRRKVGAD